MIHLPRTRWLVVAMLAAGCGGQGQDARDDTSGATAPPEERAPEASVMPTDTPGGQRGTPDTASGTPAAPAQSPLPPPSRPSLPSMPIAGADTATGTVSLLGTAIDARVVVQTKGGPIGIAGDLAETIRGLQGMDIWVQGPLSIAIGRVIPPRQITVQRFEVRAAGGVPALDGTLREEGGTLVLATSGGERRRLADAPDRLRRLAGRRVWLTLAADGTVASFGSIE